MEKLFEFSDAVLGYRRCDVLSGVNVSLLRGDFIGLIGPNGSGKTTFLKTVMRLIDVKKGGFENLSETRFGYCMQRDFLSNIFPFTVMEIVLMALAAGSHFPLAYSNGDRQKAEEALSLCGIGHLGRSRFYNLSGGQQQRVIIARALALEPGVLILDEPTIDLDIKGKKEILDLIASLYREKNMTVMLVSHELNHVINYAEKFLFFAGNRVHGVYAREDISEGLLSEIFQTEVELLSVKNRKVVV